MLDLVDLRRGLLEVGENAIRPEAKEKLALLTQVADESNPIAEELMQLAMKARNEATRAESVTDALKVGDFTSLLCPLLGGGRRDTAIAGLFDNDVVDLLFLSSSSADDSLQQHANLARLRSYVKLLQEEEEGSVSVEIVALAGGQQWSLSEMSTSSSYVIGVVDNGVTVFLANIKSRTILSHDMESEMYLQYELSSSSSSSWVLGDHGCDSPFVKHDHGVCVLCSLVGVVCGPPALDWQVLKLQIAYELMKNRLLPRSLSFLDLISRHHPRRKRRSVAIMDQFFDAKVVEQRLAGIGFVVLKNFFSVELDQVNELKRLVRQSNSSEFSMQSARFEWLKDHCSEVSALKAVLSNVEARMQGLFPCRETRDAVAFLTLPGSGEPRAHTDFSPEDVKDVVDDGVCGGLPVEAVVAVQPFTLFDIWPGAVSWDQKEFFEHMQLSLDAGSVCLFLGTAVHAGAAAQNEENVRLHMYIEAREMRAKTDRDGSFFMDGGVGMVNILPRGVELKGK